MPIILTSLPTSPTLTSLATEGLQKTGYLVNTVQFANQLQRATTQWMEEIKNDIFTVIKNPKFLQLVIGQATVAGQSTYLFPSDFSALVNGTLTLMDGTVRSTFQAGSTTTAWILNIGNTLTDLVGKEILITSGVALGQIGQVTAYDAASKTATVVGASVAPSSGDAYLIVTTYYELTENMANQYDKENYPTTKDIPVYFMHQGNTSVEQYTLFPAPDKVYGIKIRYYANLMNLDLAGASITTLYQRWRNVWVQGIFAKSLQDSGDSAADNEISKYESMIKLISGRESYGVDLSNLQIRMVE